MSIAAEFQIHDLELFSYFRQTGYAKILALQQIVASLANQLANRIELQSNHTLSCSNRQIQLGNWTIEEHLLIGSHATDIQWWIRFSLFV